MLACLRPVKTIDDVIGIGKSTCRKVRAIKRPSNSAAPCTIVQITNTNHYTKFQLFNTITFLIPSKIKLSTIKIGHSVYPYDSLLLSPLAPYNIQSFKTTGAFDSDLSFFFTGSCLTPSCINAIPIPTPLILYI